MQADTTRWKLLGPRKTALTQSLRVLLEPLVLGRNSDDALFPAVDMRYAWKRLCKQAAIKAGRKGSVIHDARRTAARTKRSAGVGETMTFAIMGWKPGSQMFARLELWIVVTWPRHTAQ